MSTQRESSLQAYPDTLRRFRQRHDEFNILKPILKELATNADFIKDAETVLSVGTGYGQYDIEFFRYFPKLKKLIIVEKNPDCVKELIPNLKACFGDKVEFEIHQISVEKFLKQEASLKLQKKLDVVASFHGLLFLNSDDRREFFRFCFDFWLKPSKGKLVVLKGKLLPLNAARDYIVIKYHQECAAKMRPYQDTTILRQELNDMSAVLEKEIQYTVKLDLKEYDKDLYFMTKFSHNAHIEDEEFEKAVRNFSPDGYGCMKCVLIIASS